MGKFWKKCEACKKRKWYIAYRTFKVPHSQSTMKSQSLLCTPCKDNIQKMLYSQ